MNEKTRLLFFTCVWILGSLLILTEDTFPIVFAYPFDMSKQATNFEAAVFSSDGTKMFAIGNTGHVNIYACTNYDVSNCIYSSNAEQFLVPKQFLTPEQNDTLSLAFHTDGTKSFVIKSMDGILDVSENSKNQMQR